MSFACPTSTTWLPRKTSTALPPLLGNRNRVPMCALDVEFLVQNSYRLPLIPQTNQNFLMEWDKWSERFCSWRFCWFWENHLDTTGIHWVVQAPKKVSPVCPSSLQHRNRGMIWRFPLQVPYSYGWPLAVGDHTSPLKQGFCEAIRNPFQLQAAWKCPEVAAPFLKNKGRGGARDTDTDPLIVNLIPW